MTVRSVILGLALAAGGLGLWTGWRVATLSESDVIDAYAAHYVAEARAQGNGAASVLDCVAYPVDWPGGHGWIAVRCGVDAVWHVNRLGFEVGPGEGAS